MIRFNFPPEPTSKVHAENTGVTEYIPTLDIAENGCFTAYGKEPNNILRLIWELERRLPNKMTYHDKVDFVKRTTGLSPC